MADVLIRKADYDYQHLKPVVFEIMDTLAGGQDKARLPCFDQT